jgi:MerR family transcriptional regulator, light-induced transcriptional regulator
MSPTDETPLYNIGLVARITGVPVSTLRVWERRYDFPETTRTAGGQRLYSERELARLRWVKARLDQGMQVSQAIRALKLQDASSPPPEFAATAPATGPAVALDAVRAGLLSALHAHQLEQADEVLNAAVQAHPPEQLIEHVIYPVLDELGRGWQAGIVNPATEHLATNYLRHRMLLWMLSGPPVYPGARPVVLACAPGELHEGSLIMLGVLLRRRRWPVAYLGQTLPLADLAHFTQESQPAAIVLVAMTEAPAAALVDWPTYLPEAAATGKPLVAYGGYIFRHAPEWQARVPGLYLGDSIVEGLERLDALLLAQVGLGPAA